MLPIGPTKINQIQPSNRVRIRLPAFWRTDPFWIPIFRTKDWKKIWTYALKMFPLMKRKGKNGKTKSGCWCENKFAVWIVCTAEDDCVLQCCFLFDCLAEHFWQTLLAVLGIFSATRIHIRFWSEFSLCCPPRCGQPPQPALPTVWLYPSRYTEGQQTFKCSLFVVICSLLPVMCSL